MLNNKKKLFWLILFSFLLIPLIVSVISSIHVINFFEISNNKALAIALSVSFEIGALSALAGLVVLDKINKNVIYFIFILLTAYQMMGNTYFAYDIISQKMTSNPDLIKNWAELFGFDTEEMIPMKRLIAIISGAILPIVSLCFLDLSVDYIKKSAINQVEDVSESDKKKTLTELTTNVVEEIKETTVEVIDNQVETDEIEIIENQEKEVNVVEEPTTEKVDVLDETLNVTEDIKTINDEFIELRVNEVETSEENHNTSTEEENTVKSKKNTIIMKPRSAISNVTYQKQD